MGASTKAQGERAPLSGAKRAAPRLPVLCAKLPMPCRDGPGKSSSCHLPFMEFCCTHLAQINRCFGSVHQQGSTTVGKAEPMLTVPCSAWHTCISMEPSPRHTARGCTPYNASINHREGGSRHTHLSAAPQASRLSKLIDAQKAAQPTKRFFCVFRREERGRHNSNLL